MRSTKSYLIALIALISFLSIQSSRVLQLPETELLRAVKNEQEGTIAIFHEKESSKPLLVINAGEEFRPYLHPLVSPDGKSVLTEFSPGHHKHQTGIYWGLTRINGRDYFHNPGKGYWKRVSFSVLTNSGNRVSWETVYDLLDEKGVTLLTETQTWALSIKDKKYYLDFEWSGKAQQDLTFQQYDYGGLFVRMPWKEGMEGSIVNAARQTNMKAASQPAMWIDLGLQLDSPNNWAHITLLDHPGNRGYPESWRVDNTWGVGTAKSKKGEWKLGKGMTELVRHQLIIKNGEFNDKEINNDWSAFSGKSGMLATKDLWNVAKDEGKTAKFLTADEAIAAMTIKKGYKVNTWASEPLMTQPMAFCWDDRGRLWIAENRDYESRGNGFSNAGDSRILILEDTDGDGKADSRKVFMEGIPFPAALAVGFDGVFVGAPPNLLFVPDRNKDDKADTADIEVRLSGWGIRDRHETLNSFQWGPDGWLYGLQGFATPSTVGKPIGKGRLFKKGDPFPNKSEVTNGAEINGGVWRYHPTKEIFEVVAHGFSNPWGIDFDANGQLFITACVIPHLWHVVPGGIYHRQGGQHFNPYHYSDIKTIADHSHRSAHGGARIYQSDAFSHEQKGRIFMANIHEHAVLSDVLERKGSGFTGKHGEEFLMANNAQWVGFSMEIGPDGGLYILDWHDADICGSEVLNSETGRVFRIMPEKTNAEQWSGRYGDLTTLSDLELAKLQTSKSDWHTRRARIILQSRATKKPLQPEAVAFLNSLFQQKEDPGSRMKAMWTLHVTGNLTRPELLTALSDQNEYVRSWAIQFLCETNGNQPDLINKLVTMANKDSSPVVRLYLASALQRLEKPNRWGILEGLVKHKTDNTDHNLPKMLWFAIEPLVKESPEKALQLAYKSNIDLIVNYTSRRIADAGKLSVLLNQFPKGTRLAKETLKGITDALDGIPDQTTPPAWNSLYPKLATLGDSVGIVATAVNQRLKHNQVEKKLLAEIQNKALPLPTRKNAVNRLTATNSKKLAEQLPALIQNPELRTEAIRAVGVFDDVKLAAKLLEEYPTYSTTEKTEVVKALSGRPAYGALLTKAIASKTVPKKDVPPYVARQLLRSVGSGFVEIWGPIESSPGSLEEEYRKYRKLLSNDALTKANLNSGEKIFRTTCSPCHKLNGKGGDIGPDITGANRSNIDYLLTNILEPNADIQDDYRMVVVTTRDGRTLTGNVSSENTRQITLKVIGQAPVIIVKSAIQSMEVTPLSLMPPGLLTNLDDQEVINLVAFLKKIEVGGK